jgi:hypothetical protein
MREAEVADLKKQFDDAANAASNVTKQIENPLESTRKEIENTFADKPAEASSAEPPSSAPTDSTAAKPETPASPPAKPEGGAA